MLDLTEMGHKLPNYNPDFNHWMTQNNLRHCRTILNRYYERIREHDHQRLPEHDHHDDFAVLSILDLNHHWYRNLISLIDFDLNRSRTENPFFQILKHAKTNLFTSPIVYILDSQRATKTAQNFWTRLHKLQFEADGKSSSLKAPHCVKFLIKHFVRAIRYFFYMFW